MGIQASHTWNEKLTTWAMKAKSNLSKREEIPGTIRAQRHKNLERTRPYKSAEYS
jgi:hypothetical protein